MLSNACITAIGSYAPEERITNRDLEKLVDTNDEWIIQRTGMRERRKAHSNEYTSDLAIAAVENMMKNYGVGVEDVELIIVCTHSPDYAFPSVATQIQTQFQIRSCGSFDLNATCAGFPYGLHMANGMVSSGLHRKVLVVAADSMTKITDYSDRSNCILFGDAAGAALIEYSENGGDFLGFRLGTDGDKGQHVYRTGLSKTMNGKPLLDNGCFQQNGREVYKWAVRELPAGIDAILQQSQMSKEHVDWFVPHSANLRMIESICDKSGISMAKTLHSVEYFGNTSAASIPLSLDHGVAEGKVKNGNTLLMYGFGGGLVQAGLLIRWNAGPRSIV